MLDLVVSAGSGCFLWTFKVGWGCTKPILTLCKKFHKFPWYVTRLLQLEVEGLGIWGVWNALYFPKLFSTFPLRGDRCGEIPVGVDVGKISSGFSMNINEFSQPATSHLCENVCLLNKLNLSFRFRVWRRNSSLFPPNQYFFEGKGATLHSAPYFFEPGNQYFFELDNISPGFFVIGPRSHHYLLNLHNLIETLRMTQELVFCRFDTSSKLTIWNGWKSYLGEI